MTRDKIQSYRPPSLNTYKNLNHLQSFLLTLCPLECSYLRDLIFNGIDLFHLFGRYDWIHVNNLLLWALRFIFIVALVIVMMTSVSATPISVPVTVAVTVMTGSFRGSTTGTPLLTTIAIMATASTAMSSVSNI